VKHLLAQLDAVPGGPALRRAAAAASTPAYLVGGAVRDLLLGRPPRELDVAVEGDLTALVDAIGGAVEHHPRFGTAIIRGEGWCVDVARCRTEYYPDPGALPDVAPADIRADLLRRDATVNAIAVALADGEVVAAPHALEDLRAGVLRVLHDRSFLDDPTRLWRLARYRARLGFELEAGTAALAGAAVDGGALGTVSGVRIGNELRLALVEDDPVAALASAAALGLAPWLHPDRERIDAACELLPAGGRVELAVLAAALGSAADAGLLDAFGFPAADRDIVMSGLAVRRGGRTPAGDRPSQIAAAFRGLPDEAVAVSPPAQRAAAARWLRDLRDIRLAIDGDDLIAAGIPQGPEVGARLDATLAAVLDGEVPPTREAQLAAALGSSA
jgi:tRNA nucleotidyltransferase (CCA-adding enzyme)